MVALQLADIGFQFVGYELTFVGHPLVNVFLESGSNCLIQLKLFIKYLRLLLRTINTSHIGARAG